VMSALSTVSRVSDSARFIYEATLGELPDLTEYDELLLSDLQRDFSRRWCPSSFITHGWRLPWLRHYPSYSTFIPASQVSVAGGSCLGISHSTTSVSARELKPRSCYLGPQSN
jgi:hypothetical protein